MRSRFRRVGRISPAEPRGCGRAPGESRRVYETDDVLVFYDPFTSREVLATTVAFAVGIVLAVSLRWIWSGWSREDVVIGGVLTALGVVAAIVLLILASSYTQVLFDKRKKYVERKRVFAKWFTGSRIHRFDEIEKIYVFSDPNGRLQSPSVFDVMLQCRSGEKIRVIRVDGLARAQAFQAKVLEWFKSP